VEVKGIGRRSIGELGESLRSADWLVMALPGDTGTDDIVSAAELRCMKRTAVIVNVGRGNAIEERALAAALKSRRIAGAYLDVFKKEPLAASSPLAADLPGLVRLPHASAFAPEYLPMFFREMAAAGWMK
jgi:phosphoglycerate dehydrogenase-like enzyme